MRNSLLLVASLFMTGCISASNQTDFDKVKPKQRVYVGNVSVEMNGQRPEKCELLMNKSLVANVKLSRDGYVVYKTSDRKPALAKVRCLHKVSNRKHAWHTKDLDLEPLKRPKKRKSVNYFGHLKVNWEINPELTTAAPVENPAAFKQVGMVSDSGEIKLEVKDETDQATKYIQDNWVALNGFRVETHLAKPQAADEDEELDEEEYED